VWEELETEKIKWVLWKKSEITPSRKIAGMVLAGHDWIIASEHGSKEACVNKLGDQVREYERGSEIAWEKADKSKATATLKTDDEDEETMYSHYEIEVLSKMMDAEKRGEKFDWTKALQEARARAKEYVSKAKETGLTYYTTSYACGAMRIIKDESWLRKVLKPLWSRKPDEPQQTDGFGVGREY